jgi:hypothetical protein
LRATAAAGLATAAGRRFSAVAAGESGGSGDDCCG